MSALSLPLLAAAVLPLVAAEPNPQRAQEELRNTVINLLQGLVDRGVLTREQAEQMVSDARARAEADASAQAVRDAAEAGAVRVPYVPEIVKQEIREQVKEELRVEVSEEVQRAAREDGWGVPAALPEWVRQLTWYGDARIRGEGTYFSSDNFPHYYLDYQAINEAGGTGPAGLDQYMNVSEDRQRLRLRLRLGVEAEVGNGWSMGARLSSGSLDDPISPNQTLGTGGARHVVGLDLAYVGWRSSGTDPRQRFAISGGRIGNPWFTATDLVYDHDLTFDGVAMNWRLGRASPGSAGAALFAIAGAFPLEEVELAKDKWLLGGQLGLDWGFAGGSRLRAAVGFHDFHGVHGVRNALDSHLLDYTAPRFLGRGNTVFDIRSDNDPGTQLYALVGDYRLATGSLIYDIAAGDRYEVSLAADYVQNVGFHADEVLRRSGLVVPERKQGYQAELSFGHATADTAGAWRFAVGYRYVQGDAVMDAYTDSDFHLGGTDAKGYTLDLQYSLTPRVLGRIRYLSASEIDGPPLGIDLLQVDVSTRF